MLMSIDISPNFIVIGPGKSGTTWMYQVLKEHPEVCVSSAKETLYFEKYYDKGISWYSKFFKHCDKKNIKAIGEISNTYIFSEDAPKRIFDFDKNIKLISSCRNPIDRAFSHYLFLKRNGTYSKSFEEAINEERHIIERGLYHKYFKNYLEYFEREQLLILIYQDLKDDPLQFSATIFSFLAVESLSNLPSQNEKILVASKARNKYISLATKKSAEIIRELGYPEIIESVKGSIIPKLLYKPLDKRKKTTEKILDSTRSYLSDFYRKDIEQLSDLINRDLIKLWL